MKSVNKVILIGNLGKDPEVKYTPQGTAVANFSVACNERYKDKNDEWQDRTEWVNVQAWARTAEIVGEYLHKGSQVYIEGRLKTDSWEDKQSGEKKYRTQVVVNDLVLLGGKKGSSSDDDFNQERKPSAKPAQQQQSGYNAQNSGPITDDDLPF
jgi:single-strand DNA-binding protein